MNEIYWINSQLKHQLEILKKELCWESDVLYFGCCIKQIVAYYHVELLYLTWVIWWQAEEETE